MLFIHFATYFLTIVVIIIIKFFSFNFVKIVKLIDKSDVFMEHHYYQLKKFGRRKKG